MSEHSDDACEVPLVERLRSVPSDARAEVEVGYCHQRYIPYGRLCHDAATKIRYFEAELAAANAEVARLQAGGCARDQRTTQFCAEAVELSQKLAAANARIAELEKWINALELYDTNDRDRRSWCNVGWIAPGHCVFLGPQKPEGLR